MNQAEFNSFSLKKHYEKLGSAGIKGSLYQIDLLTMVLLNGLRKVENWRLSTEDKAAAQLDDLIFEHLPSESAILLQAKHKEDERKEVTYKDLMSVSRNSEFSLPKYFFSYQEVKIKFKVRNVVICTNLKLDNKTKIILKEEIVDPKSVLHFEGDDNICYRFSARSLPELKQNIKRYYAKNIRKKKVVISDEDINDFINHLIFFPNCLGDKIVEHIVQLTISQMKYCKNLNIKIIQNDIHKKVTDWFKEKKGRYLYKVEAKAFFCHMRSNKYCEDLNLYDIRFKKNNLPLIFQTQQKDTGKAKKSRQKNAIMTPVEDPKRISHIIPDKEYMLNVVKIYQALPTHHKEKVLFVNPDENVKIQKEIVDAFGVQHYTILVIVCPNIIEKTMARDVCGRVMEILDTYKYKHVILIAEEKNYLAIQLKLANINYYEVITDNITVGDLEETTQEDFKRKKFINFQGSIMSLKELFAPQTENEFNQIVTSEMLVKLARGVKFEVGLDLPHPDNYYISRSFNQNGRNIFEEDLWRSTEDSEEKIVLISDSAGVGKSSVLSSLAISIKRDNPHLWVVRFDLNSYTNILKIILEGHKTSVSIVELLNSQETSRLKSEFHKKLFTTPKRVVLMLDGVDEISPTYTQLVLNLIRNSLVQVNLAKIFVTTRPHIFKDFEGISHLQSLTLQPFSKVNQTDFLTKYWTETLDLRDDMGKRKCNIFAEALIENISVWLNEKDQNNFAGIPLQTRMLAEIFQQNNEIIDEGHDWEGCKEFLFSNNEMPNLPARIDLTHLYKLFIDKKCDIYIKRINPSRHSAVDEALKFQLERCENFHRALALKVMFDSDDKLQIFTCFTNTEWPIPSKFANNFLFGVGIVQRQGGNIEFLHRTFAEYFAAECLLTELDSKPANEVFQQFFMQSILMDKQFCVIRAFLNSRMRNVWHLIENNFCNYFSRNIITECSLSKYFNVFATEGCANIFECLIDCINKTQREILPKTVNEMYLMYAALFSATQYGHINILKLLLQLNESFNKGRDAHKQFLAFVVIYAANYNLRTFKFLLRQVDKRDENIFGCPTLHEAVFIGRFGEVELWVVEARATINIEDEIRRCDAISMDRLQLVKFLVEELGADINFRDSNGETILHGAAFLGGLEIVKYLVEEAGTDVNAKDNVGETVLHRAAYWGRLPIVTFLKQIGADINAKNNNYETALHRAVLKRQLETVKFLVREAGADTDAKDNDGETALHRAVLMRQLEIVKLLVEKSGEVVNVKNNNGETALHRAVFMRQLDSVKFLVEEAGADMNVKDNDGKTALHRAVLMRRLEIVKFLGEKAGADINIRDNDGRTALHGAAYEGELEIVKFLIKAGADTNITDNDGETALHRAAYWGKLEIVKFLVEEAGTDINVKDNEGETALHRAAYEGELKIVKFLVEEAGADTNAKDNEGETALHKASYEGELEIIKFLVEEAGADINAKDNEGETALHRAVYEGKLDLVRFLVDELGADVNVKENNGETALHGAAFMGGLAIVKYLVKESRADISIRDINGETALHGTAYKGQLEVAKFLVEEAGADINVKNNCGETVLHKAAYWGKLAIVKFLVEEAGANINIKDAQGRTALWVAASRGHSEVVKFLLFTSSCWVTFKMKTTQFLSESF